MRPEPVDLIPPEMGEERDLSEIHLNFWLAEPSFDHAPRAVL
jgi:hypothetical protein